MYQQNDQQQQIEMFVCARSLKDKDIFSKSDPYIQFCIKDTNNGQWIPQGRTETIQNNLNPNFQKSFITTFIFEVKQECRFNIYDDDDETSKDSLGFVETTIGKLMSFKKGAQKQTSILDITTHRDHKHGKLIVRCDTIKESNLYVKMKWGAFKLMNTDGWFDKSDPFLRFLKIRDDNSSSQVHETEFIKDNLNPQWQPFALSLSRLCNDDVNRGFKIECWDHEKSGKHQFIGDLIINLNEIKLGKKDFDLINPKHKKPGHLRLESFQIYSVPTFLDYLRGGLQLNQIIAVDFTGSNGIPTQSSSLHFMNPNSMNQYQQAILGVGEILLAYDFDQRVPCFGFGAKTFFPSLQSREVLHCFPLSGDPQQIEAFGLSQIMDQYCWALKHVQLGGPTYFAPIISEALRIASQIKQEEQNIYTIMLILTDGEINDMQETKDLIVQASKLPLSIVIVGIGNADFSNMDILDGDDGLYDSRNIKASRDLVQFVPFRNFKGNQPLLAKHVLAEIPQQVVNYHLMMGKQPNPPLINEINQMGFSQYPNQPVQQQQNQQQYQY